MFLSLHVIGGVKAPEEKKERVIDVISDVIWRGCKLISWTISHSSEFHLARWLKFFYSILSCTKGMTEREGRDSLTPHISLSITNP